MALDFLAGMFGGAAGVLVGHPFDTVKVRLQTQPAVGSPGVRYTGTLDCFRKIYQQESLRGFFKGISSPLAGLAFMNAIAFGVYGNAMKLFRDHDSIRTHCMAGGMAGFAQSIVCSPMELAKLHMQLQSSAGKAAGAAVTFKNPLDCIIRTFMDQGVRGIFKGLTLTIYRDVTGFALYFASYEYITRWMAARSAQLTTDHEDHSHFTAHLGAGQLLLAGGFAGAFSWCMNYPIDVVKSRFQVDGAVGAPIKYRSIPDCIQQSYRAEGARVFGQGLTSAMLRAFPTNAVTFFTVSMTFRFAAYLEQYEGDGENASEYGRRVTHFMEAGTTFFEPTLGVNVPEVDGWLSNLK